MMMMIVVMITMTANSSNGGEQHLCLVLYARSQAQVRVAEAAAQPWVALEALHRRLQVWHRACKVPLVEPQRATVPERDRRRSDIDDCSVVPLRTRGVTGAVVAHGAVQQSGDA